MSIQHAPRIEVVRDENEQAGKTWSAGGRRYDEISRQIADAIEHCVDRLDPQPDEPILDAATGTGWTARRVAERGAAVTGIDIGADVIDAARAIGPATIDFRIGDAEALEFEDASFDAVVSTFGVMFCGEPERAVAELARVCRPGGRLALATWAPFGGVREMFDVIMKHHPNPPTGRPSPFAWGEEDRLRELLADDFDIAIETATSYCRTPSGEALWETFATGYGPVVALIAALDRPAVDRLRTDFVAYHERYRTPLGLLVERPYRIVTGRRRDA